MRRVHDILWSVPTGDGIGPIPVAFIQHGAPPTYVYENICPWCASTLEKVSADAEASYEQVMNRLLQGAVRHAVLCPRRGERTLLVEVTREPLNVERIPKEV